MLPRGLTFLPDSVQNKTIAAAGPAAAAAAGFQNPLCPDALPLAVGRGRRIMEHTIKMADLGVPF